MASLEFPLDNGANHTDQHEANPSSKRRKLHSVRDCASKRKGGEALNALVGPVAFIIEQLEQLLARRDPELAVDVLDVRAGGTLCNLQVAGDDGRGATVRQKHDDLALARRQAEAVFRPRAQSGGTRRTDRRNDGCSPPELRARSTLRHRCPRA